MQILKRALVCCAMGVLGFPLSARAQLNVLPILDHVHLAVPNPADGVQWYQKHFGGQRMSEAPDRLLLGDTRLIFQRSATAQPSAGNSLDHIGFSVADLDASVKALQADGAKVTTAVREAEGLFKLAFVEDPWGTRIEVVQDHEKLGLHHVHLRSPDPAAALAWYLSQFGGTSGKLKGRLDGVNYGGVWLLAARGDAKPSLGFAIDHIGFRASNLTTVLARLKQAQVPIRTEQRPLLLPDKTTTIQISFVESPDGVRIEVVERPEAQPAAAGAQRPQIQTTKVDGTDHVYIFRNGNHQSMFIVTNDGVIATDPVAYGRPQGGAAYVAEIKKVTDKPIKYLVYSHHHFDHVAGGKAFKDAGAKIVAHKRANERLAVLKDPATPLADETFDKRRTITLGGTTLELIYAGLNHSDSSLVMRLPKEKIVFVVDFLPVGQIPGRGMIDFYPLEAEDSIRQILAMDWDRLIPGHPGPGDRLGTKKDAQDQLTFLRDASEAVKIPAREGKCWEPAEKEVRLPKYENWPGYEANMQFVLRRYCALWGRGT